MARWLAAAIAALALTGAITVTAEGKVRAEGLAPAADALNGVLEQFDVDGAVLVRRLSDGAEWTGGGARIDERFVPASTFKIPNSLIILETGVVTDIEADIVAWDGVERRPGWDQDQSLRTAFRRSAVWAYQGWTREIGHAEEQRLVSLFGYGDEHIGSPDEVDVFWLRGPLTITVREQAGFLSRLHARTLPVEATHMETVIGLMEDDRGEGWILRGKTGWANPQGGDLGWYVGWLEAGEETYVFAVNFDMTNPDVQSPQRQEIARAALEAVGAF